MGYIDLGVIGIKALKSRSRITLKNSFVQAEDFDEANVRIATKTTANLPFSRAANHKTYMRFNRLDLSQVKQLFFRLEPLLGDELEVRLDQADGSLIGSVQIPPAMVKDTNPWKDLKINILPTKGIHDLYVVYKSKSDKKQNLFHLDWIYFSNESK